MPLVGASSPPLVCPSGAAVGTIDLQVVSPSPRNEKHPLPLRSIARLEEGDVIAYRPVLRPSEERKGEVTLVLAPEDKKAAGRSILIYDARPAGKPQQWTVPWRTSVVAFVYGPSGLNVKKVQSFLDKDDELIGELADYADKTAKAEALIAALTATNTSSDAVNAAMRGFSAQFNPGATVTKGAPLDQQTTEMLRALNPAVAAYDPLAPQSALPLGQTAGLAASVAQMFLGSPAGLAVGGTAMLFNLGTLAFPRSEFRSMFSELMPEDGLGLCAKAGPPAPRTRLAYLWAVRIPNARTPRFSIGKTNSLPEGLKSPLPLNGSDEDWKYIDRARNWMLTPDRGKPVPVKVQVLADQKSIELALPPAAKPGHYTLTANWDSNEFPVSGSLEVRPLDTFLSAQLTQASHDRLAAGAGKVALTLEGADFEFVTKVEIKKLDDEFAQSTPVPFVLLKGLREGVQDRMDIQADTSQMQTGSYNLAISQLDGKPRNVRLTVLAPLPMIENLPVAVNRDAGSINVELKGKRLDLLDGIELSSGRAILGTASGGGASRNIALRLPPGVAEGKTISLRAFIAGRSEPLMIEDAVRVVAPRPYIAGITISRIPPQQVHLEQGEVPRGLAFTALMRVTNLALDSAVRLECEQDSTEAVSIRAGQQAKGARIERLTSEQLFLTVDTSAWTSGCTVQASIGGSTGNSEPAKIARIVGAPKIDQLTTDWLSGTATLTGVHLETIEKAGWSPDTGMPVTTLPQPIAGDGPGSRERQTLDLRLPPAPSPDAVFYIWLRGDPVAHETTVRAN